MARKKSSAKWRQTRNRDGYVTSASRMGVRSRSYFKLQELDKKFNLLRSSHSVLDLGASPGGWSQYALTQVGEQGKIFACDVIKMANLHAVNFIHCDLRDNDSTNKLVDIIGGRKLNVVLSDMAPNITGNKYIDQKNFADLYDIIFEIHHRTLVKSGSLVFKIFQCEATASLKQRFVNRFSTYQVHKPSASRAKSKEMYVVAKGYKL